MIFDNHTCKWLLQWREAGAELVVQVTSSQPLSAYLTLCTNEKILHCKGMLWRFLKTLLRRVEPQWHSNCQSSAGVRVWQSSWQRVVPISMMWCFLEPQLEELKDTAVSKHVLDPTKRETSIQKSQDECLEIEREISNHRFLGRMKYNLWLSDWSHLDLARLICQALWTSPKSCQPGRIAAELRSQLAMHQCCRGSLYCIETGINDTDNYKDNDKDDDNTEWF